MKGATTHLLRKTGQSEREAKREAKKATKELVTISKRQKARDEASKAGYWSGGSAVCVTLFYEVCKASNQWPFGREYEPVWTHEAMVSTMTFLMTAMFGWAYKAMHPESK